MLLLGRMEELEISMRCGLKKLKQSREMFISIFKNNLCSVKIKSGKNKGNVCGRRNCWYHKFRVPNVFFIKVENFETCSICLEGKEDCDNLLSSCGHCFHKKCMEKWREYTGRFKCPVCRFKECDSCIYECFC